MSLDASELSGLGSVPTGAAAPASSPASGVTSFNGATGVVGYAPVIPCANVAALAALPTLGALSAGGYDVGQQAFVASNGFLYTLCAALGTADALNIVATSDDATRQWVAPSVLSTGIFMSAEIDLTVLGASTMMVPAVIGKRYVAQRITTLITQTAGTLSVLPSIRATSNGGASSNVVAAGTAYFGNAGGFAAGVGSGQTASVGVVTGNVYPANAGTLLEVVTAGSGTGLTYKGRVTLFGSFY